MMREDRPAPVATGKFIEEQASVDPLKTYYDRQGRRVRPLGVAVNVSSGQPQVVYRSVETGSLHVSSVVHWHDNFRQEL